jgi:hypothetical protein
MAIQATAAKRAITPTTSECLVKNKITGFICSPPKKEYFSDFNHGLRRNIEKFRHILKSKDQDCQKRHNKEYNETTDQCV